VDAVSCYIELHAWGKLYEAGPYPLDWYTAVAVNGVRLMQATVRGIVTGLVDPRTCSATDAQNFDTHYDPDASPRLVNYITNLPIGISAFPRPRFVRTVSLVRLTFMLVYSSFVSSRIVVLVHRVIMVCTVLIVLFYRLFIL